MEARLKEHLATAERIIRLAQLSRKHELPGEDAPDALAAGTEDAAGTAAAAADEDGQLAATEAGSGAIEGGEQRARSASAGRSSGSSEGPSSSGGRSFDELGLAAGGSEQRLLEAFVQRMNGAELDAAALAQERLRLQAENTTLRAVVAAVQAGITVGPTSVEDPLSTLLVVNGRLQKELGSAALARRAAAASTGSTGGQ